MSIEETIESVASGIKNTEQLKHDPNHKFVVYGPPGSGKTYLIRTIPDYENSAIVGSLESGLASLADINVDYFPIESIQDLRDFYIYLKNADHSYKWAGIDSITEVAERCLSEQKSEYADNRQAYGEMQEIIIKLFRTFRSLEMNLYFSAKMQRETVDGQLLNVPSMPGNTLVQNNQIGHDFDYVFPLLVDEADDGNMKRRLQTVPGGGYQAKKRDPEHVLDKFEPADIGKVHKKLLDAHN